MRKMIAALAAIVLGGLFGAVVATAPAAAADPCVGTWSIGIGGLELGGAQNSAYLTANQLVGYNSWDPNSGKNEINRLFWDHRTQCPGDHIKLIGHSEGAGILHSWVTENQWVDNANAVLLADPKRWTPDTGAGLAQWGQTWFPGYPLSGVDDWFGPFPVLNVCHWDDPICRLESPDPVGGYARHGMYDMNAWDYGDWDTGTWMQ